MHIHILVLQDFANELAELGVGSWKLIVELDCGCTCIRACVHNISKHNLQPTLNSTSHICQEKQLFQLNWLVLEQN